MHVGCHNSQHVTHFQRIPMCVCVCVCVCACVCVCVAYMFCSLSQEWMQIRCHERKTVLYSVVVLRPARAYIRMYIQWGNSILLHSRPSSRVFKLHVFCCGCGRKGVVREPGGSTRDSGLNTFLEICFLKH